MSMSATAFIPKVLAFNMGPVYNLCGTLAGNLGLVTGSRWAKMKCCFRVLQCRGKFGSPKLTPLQVSAILRANECQVDLRPLAASVSGFDTNQLPSNHPIEDRRAEASCRQTAGTLFGVIDGHGGYACAEVVSRRLLRYVAASLLPVDALRTLADSLSDPAAHPGDPLLEWYNPPVDHLDNLSGFSAPLSALYRNSFRRYVAELIAHHQQGNGDLAAESKMADALCRAFLRLDQDLWDEVLAAERDPPLLAETLEVALSGAVACLAHVDGLHLHVASAGDCAAVLGTRSESGESWVAKPLTRPHSYENTDEERRIRSEHPPGEADTVIRQERLLGQLAPFRAFGDSAFKRPAADLERVCRTRPGHRHPPPGYFTPPYLTALPEVTHHRLTPRDRFLVLASDGLWEQVAPSRVVQLVGEYMQGRKTLEPFRLRGEAVAGGGGRGRRALALGEVSRLLDKRREGLEHKPADANAATHLLRSALGDTEFGVDHHLLSQMLSAPRDVVRLIRDDISIVIVFFDKNYIRRNPS